MNKETLKKIIIACFISVPLLSSIISTIHLVDLFYLGNPSWISYTIAIAIELGSIASFMTLSVMSKINKTIVWSMFALLFFMQVLGNMYFSYNWISLKIIEDRLWIKNFSEMLSFFMSDTDEKTAKMILAMIIAIPIPIISVFLLKSTTEYLGSDKEELSEKVIENNTEKPIIESVKEDPIEEKIVPEPEYTPTAEEIKEAENATEEDVPDWYRKLHPARV